ncbi:MAG: hypothetical protein JOZ58_02455 [Acetobacteraceae bacterium]|nr:hypothetical protein [Acetobacteraceae bacterium]
MPRLTLQLLALASLVALPACGTTPAALGITGPSPQGSTAVPRPPLPADQGATEAPGIPANMGRTYSPAVGPSYGTDGRYFNYN